MRTSLYYFSGTGNSLQVARDIADALGQASVISIPVALQQADRAQGECIGFVFPVYYFRIPRMVGQFLDTVQWTQGRYCFLVCTFALVSGQALCEAQARLEARGIHVSAGFRLQMPGNAMMMYDVYSKTRQERILRREKNRVRSIAAAVREREEHGIEKPLFPPAWALRIPMWYFERFSFPRFEEKFWVSSGCNGCGICEQLCPAHDIVLQDGRPQWQHRDCQACLACLNLCPQKAIEHGKRTVGHGRYRNPTVTTADLLAQQRQE